MYRGSTRCSRSFHAKQGPRILTNISALRPFSAVSFRALHMSAIRPLHHFPYFLFVDSPSLVPCNGDKKVGQRKCATLPCVIPPPTLSGMTSLKKSNTYKNTLYSSGCKRASMSSDHLATLAAYALSIPRACGV